MSVYKLSNREPQIQRQKWPPEECFEPLEILLTINVMIIKVCVLLYICLYVCWIRIHVSQRTIYIRCFQSSDYKLLSGKGLFLLGNVIRILLPHVLQACVPTSTYNVESFTSVFEFEIYIYIYIPISDRRQWDPTGLDDCRSHPLIFNVDAWLNGRKM